MLLFALLFPPDLSHFRTRINTGDFALIPADAQNKAHTNESQRVPALTIRGGQSLLLRHGSKNAVKLRLFALCQ